MPPDALAEFEAAARTAFNPLAIDATFIEAMYEELGGCEGVADAVRASVGEHFEGALLRTAVTSARRLFGMTPMGLLKMLPRGWPMVYRDIGTPSLKRHGDRSAIFLLEDVVPELFDMPGYPASFQGIVHGTLEVTGQRGTVVTHPDRDQHTIQFTASW